MKQFFRNKWNYPILLVLLIGLGVFFYPYISNMLAARNHSKAIYNYSVTAEQMTAAQKEEYYREAELYNESLTGLVVGDPFGETEGVSDWYLSILDINGMIGYIEIPSIEVYLPIYHTTGKEVLERGVGHLESTSFPIGGAGNHSVLTAHRGLPASRLFTDLNLLEDGDYFFIHILGDVYSYRVDRILVTEPDQTQDLMPVRDKDYVTLITCTPYAINSHRLLVRGERTYEEPEEIAAKQKNHTPVWILAVLMSFGIIVFLLKKRKVR